MPGSDVDVLVDMRDASFERVVDLVTKLSRLVGRRVDVVVLEDAAARDFIGRYRTWIEPHLRDSADQ